MLVKDVLRCLKTLLKEEGFCSSVHGVMLRPIRSGFEMFLGLNTVTHRVDGVVGINPVVGLRDHAVENLVTELTGHRGIGGIATLSVSLGYLMPERRYIEWEFDTADHDMARSLRDSVRTFGYPVIESLASLGAVIEALRERRMTVNENRAYRLPVAYLLQGRKDQAIQELQRELDTMRGRTDVAAVEFRLFAERLENKANAVEGSVR